LLSVPQALGTDRNITGEPIKWVATNCRPKSPLSLVDALRAVDEFVNHYNEHRLNGAIGYFAPRDMIEGRQGAIHAARDRKLEHAHEERDHRRTAFRGVNYDERTRPEDRAMLGSNPSAAWMPKASVVDAISVSLTASTSSICV